MSSDEEEVAPRRSSRLQSIQPSLPTSSLVTPDERKPAAKRKETEGKETSSTYFKRQKSTLTCETASLTSSSSNSSSIGQTQLSFKDTSKSEVKALSEPPTEKAKVESQVESPAQEIINIDDSDHDSSSMDDSDDEDRPFQVDHAPTGRASCRTCDENIARGCLRVSHAPLFRGKPGFRVYRHLECALFSEEVTKAQDVGGWKKLSRDEVELLALRIEEARLEQEIENEELQPDELVQVTFQGEIRKPPPGLVASLLPFQVEGISWMYHQEVNVPEIRGGILADEMGMGKTIQTIGAILDNRPLLQHSKPGAKHPPASDIEARKREEVLWKEVADDWSNEMVMNSVPKHLVPAKGAMRAGTLVICPLIALSQWKSEIEKFTAPNTLSVGLYHGPNRGSEMSAKLLQKYDVVLTTYQVLEQDFRKMVSPNKVTCPNCKVKFKIDKLRIHLKYFCGEGAKRTEAQSRQLRHDDSRRGSRSNSKKKSNTKNSKPKMTPSQVKKKKTVKIKRTHDYESDSELSIDSNENAEAVTPPSGRRPSRAAAQSATKKLAESVNQWSVKAPMTKGRSMDTDDESSFSSESEKSENDSEMSDDKELVLAKKPSVGGKKYHANQKRNGRIKMEKKPMPSKTDSVKEAGSEASEIESDESDHKNSRKRSASKKSDALERARKREAEAFSAAKNNKKDKNMKNKGKNGAKKLKSKQQKKFEESGETSDDDGSDESHGDPMEGINIDALMKEAMSGATTSLLHSFCWWRVVLDEAHFIKSRSSQTAAAAFSLASIHRWCLSGTPLQNRVGELYSLIRFLRIDPMAHYFCRIDGCGCKSIHYRMKEGKCLHCGHRAFSHFAHFNKHVLGPIQRDGYSGDGRRAMFKLKNEVLDKCLLRRTKETRAEDMNLPPRIVTIRTVRLHPREEDFYQGLYSSSKANFDDYVAEGTLLNHYAHIFDLLTKMRQAVDHPYLIVHSKQAAVRSMGQKAIAIANGSVECELCHEPPTDRVVSSCCGAGFCRSCVVDYLTVAGGENTPCPSCEAPFTVDLSQVGTEDVVDDGTLTVPADGKDRGSDHVGMPSLREMNHVATGSILRRIPLAEFTTSTKIEVLIQELIEMRQKRPGSKALVFSQFVNMLDLIRWRIHSDPCLQGLGLGVRILHGGMDVKSRDEALKDFRENSGCRVLLMSLKAAGVALNLTVASECYLMDLWWNPAAEMQAIDRTHRLGQYKPIRAVRFVAEGTVEERVLQLQEKKRLVFDGTVGRDAGSLKMLTVDDMKALFT